VQFFQAAKFFGIEKEKALPIAGLLSNQVFPLCNSIKYLHNRSPELVTLSPVVPVVVGIF